MFISRSQLESYISTCQYQSYLNYGLEVEGQKIGLSSTFKSIDLACGSAIHSGIEFFLKSIYLEYQRSNIKDLVPPKPGDDVFNRALAKALESLKEDNIRDVKIPADNDFLQEFSVKEHEWLLEALLYAWFKIELPKILANYKVVLVEKEIEVELTKIQNKNKPKPRALRSMEEAIVNKLPVEFEDEPIILASRCDALLLELESGTLEAWSLKSTKQMGIFTDQMVNRDLQTALEIFAIEYWLKKQAELKELVETGIAGVFSEDIAQRVTKFLSSVVPTASKNVESVKYTFFVKGARRDLEKKDNGFEEYSKIYGFGEEYKFYPFRSNSYLYGYRKLIETTTQDGSAKEFEYAHSFGFFKPENKSGTGKLGKGWYKFAVAEDYPGGIRQWIDDINSGKVQPDAKNPIENYIVVQKDSRVESQLEAQVFNARRAAEEFYQRVNSKDPAREFLANTKSCTWPSLCNYALICQYSGASLFSPEVAEAPIVSGLYQIRIPHHEPERKYFASQKEVAIEKN